MRHGSFWVTSSIQACCKLQTSLKRGSGWQMSASVPLRRESSAAITHCLFLVVLVVTQRADQICLTQLPTLQRVFPFRSAEGVNFYFLARYLLKENNNNKSCLVGKFSFIYGRFGENICTFYLKWLFFLECCFHLPN